MIIDRYLLREVGWTFLGVSTLLLLIYFSSSFIRILSEAADGAYPVDIVLHLFALKSVGNLAFILPFSLFITVLLALGRLYKDSEMTALAACGVSPLHLLRPVGIAALGVVALLALLVFHLVPWAEGRADALLRRAQASSELEGLAPGRFNQPFADGPLIYVEAAEAGALRNVFAYAGRPDRLDILAAAEARERVDPASGERYVVFTNGYRYEGLPGSGDLRVIRFAEHGIRLADREMATAVGSRHAFSTLQLLVSRDPRDLGELHWRLAVPVSALLLALLAVPLARTSPRQGRYGRLFVGVLIYIAYNNLLTLARSALVKGQIPAELGLWWVHALVAVLLLALLWSQRRLPGPRRWLPGGAA